MSGIHLVSILINSHFIFQKKWNYVNLFGDIYLTQSNLFPRNLEWTPLVEIKLVSSKISSIKLIGGGGNSGALGTCVSVEILTGKVGVENSLDQETDLLCWELD